MKSLLIVLAIVVMFAYGYWIMSRLDRFMRWTQTGTVQNNRRNGPPRRTLIASLMCRTHHL